MKPTETWSPLGAFRTGQNLEPYDAGIVAIDLAARVIGVDSSYSYPSVEGSVKIDSEFSDFAGDDGVVRLPYRLPADWKVVRFEAFEGAAAARRSERSAHTPVDLREVLYGAPLIDFLIDCLYDSAAGDRPVSAVHAAWLMGPRDDLFGRTPRQVLFAKEDSISFDLHTRSLQYSFTKICPKPISKESHAYRYAGFGSQEIIVYYDYVRAVIGELGDLLYETPAPGKSDIADRARTAAELWLRTPSPDYGRCPGDIIEAERVRLNLTMSADECLIDDDCPCCIAMYEDFDTPMFWFLDGHTMDDAFEFSMCKTREEWEAKQEEWRRFDAEWEERRAERSDDDFGREDLF